MQALQTSLEDLGIELLNCASSEKALQVALAGGCSTLIVDFDLPGANEVIRMAALLPAKQKPALIAIASRAWPGTGQAFQSGASRILYRPLDKDQLREALKSGRKRGHDCRRRSTRYEAKTLVYLDFEQDRVPAMTIDISEHGMALQATEPVPMTSNLPFRCALPGTHCTLQGYADVVWASDQGRAGLFFSKLTPAARKHLKDWLRKRSRASHAGKHRTHRSDGSVHELLPPEEDRVAFSMSE